MDKLKLVKNTVFTMTFILILGSLLLMGTIYKKTRTTPVALPSNISLGEPAGSNIKQLINNGDKLYLLVQGGGQSDRILIFSLDDGNKISILNIN